MHTYEMLLVCLQGDVDARRSKAVYDGLKRARTGLAGAGNVELGICRARRPHAHGREIVAAGKADVARTVVGDTHQREVGRRLRVVAIGPAKIETVEVGARKGIARTA